MQSYSHLYEPIATHRRPLRLILHRLAALIFPIQARHRVVISVLALQAQAAWPRILCPLALSTSNTRARRIRLMALLLLIINITLTPTPAPPIPRISIFSPGADHHSSSSASVAAFSNSGRLSWANSPADSYHGVPSNATTHSSGAESHSSLTHNKIPWDINPTSIRSEHGHMGSPYSTSDLLHPATASALGFDDDSGSGGNVRPRARKRTRLKRSPDRVFPQPAVVAHVLAFLAPSPTPIARKRLPPQHVVLPC